jgi:hypothetical protein
MVHHPWSRQAVPRCREAPTNKTIVIIGDKAYVTRDEAERQVKIVCREK